ncbi:MAG: GFA family protein, partial [Pseudomonadota bacterium]
GLHRAAGPLGGVWMSAVRTGGCLCGKVRFTAKVKPEINACHCTHCQRWTGGGPLFTVTVEDLEITGGAEIRPYHHSTWGERSVCGTCGATLYWKMQGRPIATVAAGLLDDQTGLTVTSEIFVDDRPPWLPPWPGAEQSTEAQEMAKLSAFLEGENT